MKIYIIGSCVTRDAFEFCASDHEIIGYNARASLGSVFLSKPFAMSMDELEKNGKISSAWQRKQMEIDTTRQLEAEISRVSNDYDAFVLDFIDERFALAEFQGTIATYSVSFQECAKSLPEKLLLSGTDEHFTYWQAGFDKFKNIAEKLNKPIIINEVWWAQSSISKNHYDKDYISQGNAYLAKLYTYTKLKGCRHLNYQERQFRIDEQHKWGIAPFHFEKDVYALTIKLLDQVETHIDQTD